MSIGIALIRKNLLDVRWMLLLIAATLFWFCWLFVYIPHMIEKGAKADVDKGSPSLRSVTALETPSIVIEMRFWDNVPLFPLLLGLWAISRGSALAGEIERGSLDLVISRPVRRWTYLAAHVFVSTFGMLLIVSCMVAGNLSSAHFNPMRTPVDWLMLSKPALNMAAFTWAIYGYTFLLASVDLVRWRPILISSTVTIAAYIAHVVANTPLISEQWKWIDKLSIFSACRLTEVVTTGESFNFNVSILGLIGLTGVVIGFVLFSRRDLPAGS
jgi:ABC-2 type transport system permease protein